MNGEDVDKSQGEHHVVEAQGSTAEPIRFVEHPEIEMWANDQSINHVIGMQLKLSLIRNQSPLPSQDGFKMVHHGRKVIRTQTIPGKFPQCMKTLLFFFPLKIKATPVVLFFFFYTIFLKMLFSKFFCSTILCKWKKRQFLRYLRYQANDIASEKIPFIFVALLTMEGGTVA